jgi:hypothetical protein
MTNIAGWAVQLPFVGTAQEDMASITATQYNRIDNSSTVHAAVRGPMRHDNRKVRPHRRARGSTRPLAESCGPGLSQRSGIRQ